MKKDPRVYLAQILERIDRILEYTQEGRDSFFADVRTQDAVIRNFEVIGEAIKRIPDEYRTAQPSVPWRALAGLRDVLIHQYEGISIQEIWQMVERDLKPVRQAIAAILPPLEELERQIAGDDKPSEP
ncbi:MAG: DUF86 domain-containing protein [Desulfobacca sp.]|nr:DUF86 domain-containing protein [Desulfobacca sp.]